MNKRGFIRTLEAVIAVLIVFIFIFVVSHKSFEKTNVGVESIKSLQEGILRGVSEDEDMRNCILDLVGYIDVKNDVLKDHDSLDGKCEKVNINNYVSTNLGKRFENRYALIICDAGGGCSIPDLPDENVYTSAVLITSTLEEYKPKIVRLWVW